MIIMLLVLFKTNYIIIIIIINYCDAYSKQICNVISVEMKISS